jgi:hypothetical protein
MESKSLIFTAGWRRGSGAYQLYLPDILSWIIFQEIDAICHLNLEAEMTGSHPLVHDLVHFQPGPPPGKTPGAFMESKPGVCLYPALHPFIGGSNERG